jgi:ATP-dependent exoDNAse (exonuclease V) alpha subunit
VHAAQGVTADTTHAVLGDTASRNLAYVAMSRGRARNTA